MKEYYRMWSLNNTFIVLLSIYNCTWIIKFYLFVQKNKNEWWEEAKDEIQRISLSEMQTQKPCRHLVWTNEFNPEVIIHEIFLIK